VRNCYPAFTEQFDVLREDSVIWAPYTDRAIEARFPYGISLLCTRDDAYWMTKAKIVFDISVEVMAQQRVMRQFGWSQMVEPPAAEEPLPRVVHGYIFLFTIFMMLHSYSFTY
jgi:hypothetical protein